MAMAGAFCVIASMAPAQAAGRLIVYRHPHLISSAAKAHRYLGATPASFQKYAGRLGRAEDRLCRNDFGPTFRSGIRVQRYDTRGFALYQGGECYDSYGAIAYRAKGRWHSMSAWNRGQEAPLCSELRRRHVPARVIGPHAQCQRSDDMNSLVPYRHA